MRSDLVNPQLRVFLFLMSMSKAHKMSFETPESQAAGSYNQLISLLVERFDLEPNWDEHTSVPVAVSPPLSGGSGVQLDKVVQLQELFYDTYSLLNKLPFNDHHLLWIFSISSLTTRLSDLQKSDPSSLPGTALVTPVTTPGIDRTPSRFPDLRFSSNSLFQSGPSSLKLAILTKDILHPVSRLFLGLDPSTLLPLMNAAAYKRLYILIESSLMVIEANIEETLQNPTSSPLKSIIEFIAKHYVTFTTLSGELASLLLPYPLLLQTKKGLFSGVVKCIAISYKIDETSLLAPLIHCGMVAPTWPVDLIQNSKLDFGELIAYYKYSAFAMLATSLNTVDFAKQEYYNFHAETFFKTLLRFPNLSLSIWNNLDTKPASPLGNGVNPNFGSVVVSDATMIHNPNEAPPLGSNKQSYGSKHSLAQPFLAPSDFPHLNSASSSILSVEDRQEISLLFILNYLLRIHSIKDIVDSPAIFRNELDFLITNLLSNLSLFIQRSVSVVSMHLAAEVSLRPTSSNSAGDSGGSVTRLNNHATRKSLSSILLHGTYKERLTAVIIFLESFKKNQFNIPVILSRFLPRVDGHGGRVETAFERLVAHADVDKYPGKIKYFHAVQLIASRIRSVTFCHWINTSGVNSIPESQLKRFHYLSVAEVISDTFVQRTKNILAVQGCDRDILKIQNLSAVGGDIEASIEEQLRIRQITYGLESLTSKIRG